jgi:hypothetical protein
MTRAMLMLGLLCAPVAAHAADTIRPGYWEATSKVLFPIQSSKTEPRCVTAREVTKFMSCYINHHYTCVCPEQSYANGVIRFKGQCVDNKGQTATISGRGTYTETTLSMTADVATRWHGLPISIQATTDAHRIGDVCPADAK